jgi:hypothetical protein
VIDMQKARKALSNFCKGRQTLSVPPCPDDDDIVISVALVELEKLQATAGDRPDPCNDECPIRVEFSKNKAELSILERALRLACEEVVAVDEGNCPGCPKNNSLNFPDGCAVTKERYAQCWHDYFIKRAEEKQ